MVAQGQGPAEQSSEVGKFLDVEQHYVFFCGHLVHVADPLPVLRDFVRVGLVSQEDYRRLELAVQEALTNAVDHGNLELDSKLREVVDDNGVDSYSKLRSERLSNPHYSARCVHLTVKSNEEELTIHIKDEGRGFGKQTNIILSDTDLPKCYGRGLILIRSGTDKVLFNDVGNEITLFKRFQRGS